MTTFFALCPWVQENFTYFRAFVLRLWSFLYDKVRSWVKWMVLSPSSKKSGIEWIST